VSPEFPEFQNPKVAGVRVEELIEPRFIRKLDESGFIEKVSAAYTAGNIFVLHPFPQPYDYDPAALPAKEQ